MEIDRWFWLHWNLLLVHHNFQSSYRFWNKKTLALLKREYYFLITFFLPWSCLEMTTFPYTPIENETSCPASHLSVFDDTNLANFAIWSCIHLLKTKYYISIFLMIITNNRCKLPQEKCFLVCPLRFILHGLKQN